MHSVSAPASADTWTLVRNARQLLTLRGARGPRGGPAMAELGIVPHGALLIQNGVIREVGPTRRIENLANARRAHEIDATGRVVMPAFVDADFALVSVAPPDDTGPDSIGRMSRRKALAKAAARSEDHAKYGCLAAGAHTRCAADLKHTGRLLRVHRMVQRRPMRIRSVFAPPIASDNAGQVISKWLPAVMRNKLAAMVELTVDGTGSATAKETMVAAAGMGYAIRLRSLLPLAAPHLELALEAGAAGIVAPMDSLTQFASRLTDAGIVRVIPVAPGDESADAPQAIRCAVGHGAAVALSSNPRITLNMQHVLYLGVRNFGLTPEEAIVATTWNAACSLRLGHTVGSLEPGKAADLLVMDVDDYRDLAERAGHCDAGVVMHDGRILQRWLRTPADSGSSLSLD